MDDGSVTCANVDTGTSKMDMTSALGPCIVGKVDGVKIRTYEKDNCTDDPNGIVVATNSCFGGHLRYECNGKNVTVNTYNSESQCNGNILHSTTFKGDDDKCRAFWTPSGSGQCSMSDLTGCPDRSHACYTDHSDPCYQMCQFHCTGNSPTPSSNHGGSTTINSPAPSSNHGGSTTSNSPAPSSNHGGSITGNDSCTTEGAECHQQETPGTCEFGGGATNSLSCVVDNSGGSMIPTTCDGFTCTSDFRLKDSPTNIECASSTCTSSECCDVRPTCTAFECSTNTEVLKESARRIVCTGTICTSTECCDPNPTCADFDSTTGCPHMKTEFRHFYIPYTLKEQPTSITCRTGTCEVTECCNEDTPTCIPSDEAVLTETTETKGCMCDNEAKDETKKMCAKGSYCWTDNTCNAGKRVAQVFVLEFETTLAGVEPEEFNTNVKMIEAFKATIAQMLVGVDLKDIYDVVAIAPQTRMRLLAANEAAPIILERS
jgi:hypothetical protein